MWNRLLVDSSAFTWIYFPVYEYVQPLSKYASLLDKQTELSRERPRKIQVHLAPTMRILHLSTLVCYSLAPPTCPLSPSCGHTHAHTHTHSHWGGQKTKLTPSWPLLLCLQNKQIQLVKYTQTAALPRLQSHQPRQPPTQMLPSYGANFFFKHFSTD